MRVRVAHRHPSMVGALGNQNLVMVEVAKYATKQQYQNTLSQNLDLKTEIKTIMQHW